MKESTLIGMTTIIYTAGYRASDRYALGLLLDCTDDELDTICQLLAKWEEAGR